MSESPGYLDVFKYCPKCGSELKPKNLGFEKMPVCMNKNCGFIFWQNSKPCVVGIIRNDSGHVLMTVREIEPERGKLDLPGGFVGLGELPDDAVKREMREEVGVKIDNLNFIGVTIDHYFYQGFEETTIVFGYVAEIVSGEARVADEEEISSIEWVNMVNFDTTNLAFESNKKFLDKLIKG